MYQVVLMTITMVRMEFGLNVFIDHGSFDGYRTGELVAQTGVQAILGPRMVATTTRGGDTDGIVQGMAAGYQERGVEEIGFNTDCIDEGRFITPPQEELSLQAAMAVRYGFDNSRAQALKGLSLYPARAAHVDDRVGTVEVGKDADLIVVSGNPVDPRNWVRRVYTQGRLVYDAERDGRRW
jgi:imidazolonepropionase-like amidohydrolase